MMNQRMPRAASGGVTRSPTLLPVAEHVFFHISFLIFRGNSYLCTKFERMKRLASLICVCLLALDGNCAVREKEGKRNEEKADTASLLTSYLQALDTLVRERDSLNVIAATPVPNAYYYQLLTPPALYGSSLRQMMGQGETSSRDPQINRLYTMRKMLSALYTAAPQLVTQTEDDINGQSAIRSDVNEKLQTSDKLSDKVTAATLTPEVDGNVEVITRRPNFWKFTGDAALQFSQNYYSGNWYQGGEDNFTGMTTLTLRANYNDQRKLTWDNTLEIQLGFQTTESDTEHSFRPTNNLLRYTTNAGYKAWKSLSYSLQVILKTQIMPVYKANTTQKTTDILSPLDVTIGPGMKYGIAWGKKKAFTGTLQVSPLALRVLYVHDDDLVTNYGIEAGKNQKTTFGPSITLNTTWQICKQINWVSRIYWITNFDYNIWEWENTINFSITKLIWAKMYLYPRFDNSNERYRAGENHDGTYMMFKEWFSLGLNYSF